MNQVIGSHITGSSNADVRILNILGQKIVTHIPRHIEGFFPNIIGMQWLTGTLEEISAEDFKPFPNLKIISFYSNNLVSLDGDIFKYTPKVQWIYFSNNQLQHVGRDLLTSLSQLTEAYFEINPCISEFAITAAKIQSLKTLTEVDEQFHSVFVDVSDCNFSLTRLLQLASEHCSEV